MNRTIKALLLGAALVAGPALADVKSGVDAWERGDYAAAVREWQPAARKGDADAQFNLGQAYRFGRGVPMDMKQAESWYAKAAAQGHLQAEDNYGLTLFQNGRQKDAMPIIEKSANRGDPRAQYVLGTAYFNGDFMPRDWVRAYAMMTRASSAGLPRASESLAQMDRFIPLDERQRGLVMAREIEARAARPVLPAAPAAGPQVAAKSVPAPVRTETLPPSSAAPAAIVETAAAAAASAEAARKGPKPAAAPKPATAPAGKWRLQLGAFSSEGKARAQWAQVKAKASAQGATVASFVKAGSVTRLQAGPFASRADAQKACTALQAAGTACLVVAP